MSSRYAFSVYDTSGLKRDLQSSNFAVYKAGSLDTSITVINNNDGTYYFTVAETNKYSVKINGISQDEMTNIFIVTDDIITQDLIDTETLSFDGAQLAVKPDTFADIGHTHGNFLTGSGFDPLDFEAIADIVKLKDRSTLSGTLLSATNSLLINLRAIADKALVNAEKISTIENTIQQSTTTTIAQKRSVYVASRIAGTSIGNSPASAGTWLETSTSGVLKFACPVFMYTGDTTVVLRCNAQIASGFSGNGGNIEVKTGDGATYKSNVDFTNTDMEEIEVAVDITNATKGRMHEIQIYLKTSDATKQVEMGRYISLDIY